MQELKKITVIIPLKYDTDDRIENVRTSVKYLHNLLNPKFLIGEQGGTYFQFLEESGYDLKYHNFDNYDFFHRMKIMNDLSKMVDTEYIAIYDADVIIPEQQFRQAYQKLEEGFEIVYPYDGRFIDIERSNIVHINDNRLNSIPVHTMRMLNNQSKGGCILYNKKSFDNSGKYNENFLSWGPEDEEIYTRHLILEKKIFRINGILLHINHKRTQDSDYSNPYWQNNDNEYRKVKNMSRQQLESYIKTWSWI